MKQTILATVIALIGLSANAFARDLPEPMFRLGVHVGIGTTGYWDYPPEYLVGSDEWGGLAADLGGAFKFNINETINLLTELNFGINVVSRDLAYRSTRYGSYKQEETRTLLKTEVPILMRFKPIPFGYVEAGAQLNFNFWSGNNKEYRDYEGNSIQSVNGDLEKWDVKTHVTSLVFGLGLGGRIGDIGVRFVLDLDRIHKDDRISYYDDGERIYLYEDYAKASASKNIPRASVVDNKTKIWSIQLVVNYYFDLRPSI